MSDNVSSRKQNNPKSPNKCQKRHLFTQKEIYTATFCRLGVYGWNGNIRELTNMAP